MQLPKRAIFAFNANLDHICNVSDDAMVAIERFSPALHAQMDECFAWGIGREAAIDAKACEFLLSNVRFDREMVGGQAGNAAQTASALGVECYLHANFPSSRLLEAFSYPQRVMLASEKGFVSADGFPSQAKSAHHFVFENRGNNTRFIASYDPVPLHLDSDFCRHIDAVLPNVGHAFVGGFHLLQSTDRLGKFAEELARWKKINSKLRIFCELGDFQSKAVQEAVRERIFPLCDMVGLSDVELSSLGCPLEELAEEVPLLFHAPGKQAALPREREDAAALSFARKCASFLAEKGRHGTLAEVEAHEGGFVERPAQIVGLGDAFSCAYFLASKR